MNKYTCFPPSERILAYLEREDQSDEKALALDPEAEAVLNMLPEDLEAEALSIDPNHIAHLEHLRAMVGLAAKHHEAVAAAQPLDKVDEKDVGVDAAICKFPVSTEHRSAARARLGSVLEPNYRHHAGMAAYGRSIARGRSHLERTDGKNVGSSMLWGPLQYAAAVLILAMLTGSFSMDVQQIKNEDARNNHLAELTSRVNRLTSTLEASKGNLQRTDVIASGKDRLLYNMALMAWMFDQNTSSMKSVIPFDCSAYCKKEVWAINSDKGVYKSVNYNPTSSPEIIYASK